MADDVRVVSVKSNVDCLSADRLHSALVGMVRDSIKEMAIFARTEAPKRMGFLAEHIKDEEVEELVDLIHTKMGVTEVEEANERRSGGKYRRGEYPLFVEGGTRTPIFAVKPAGMWNPSEGIFGRKSVRGQVAKPFMLATYMEGRALLRADKSIADALHEMDIAAAARAAEIRAT